MRRLAIVLGLLTCVACHNPEVIFRVARHAPSLGSLRPRPSVAAIGSPNRQTGYPTDPPRC